MPLSLFWLLPFSSATYEIQFCFVCIRTRLQWIRWDSSMDCLFTFRMLFDNGELNKTDNDICYSQPLSPITLSCSCICPSLGSICKLLPLSPALLPLNMGIPSVPFPKQCSCFSSLLTAYSRPMQSCTLPLYHSFIFAFLCLWLHMIKPGT